MLEVAQLCIKVEHGIQGKEKEKESQYRGNKIQLKT